MDAVERLRTAWGRPPEHRDIRALRRYNRVLHRLSIAGECLAGALTALVVGIFIAFLFTGNFENIIFTDGTSLTCVFDGNTGEIIDAQK